MPAIRAPRGVIEDTASLVVAQLAAALLGLATNIVAARALPPAEFGLSALVIAYPTLVWSFVNVKSASVTTRYISAFLAADRRAEVASFTKLGVVVDIGASLAAVGLVAATLPWVTARAAGGPSAAGLTLLYAGSLPIFALANTGSAVLSSYGRFRLLAGYQVMERFTSLVVTVFLLSHTAGLSAVIIGRTAGNLAIGLAMISTVTYLVSRGGAGRWWKAPLVSLRSFRSELSSLFGWSYLSATVAGVVGQIPLLLLGSMRGPAEAGYYRLATNLLGVGRYAEGALSRIAYPQLSRLLAGRDPGAVLNTLKAWTIWLGVPSAVFLVISMPLVRYLVPSMFGAEYSPVITGTQVMLAGSLLGTAFFWIVSLYFALGRIDTWTKVQSLFGAATLGFGWIAIRLWGFDGMAWITAAAESARTIVLLALARVAVRRPEEHQFQAKIQS